MWTRAQLKENGKQLFRRNYWECVAVSLIMGIFAASSGFSGFNSGIENYEDNAGNTYEIQTWSGEAWQMLMTVVAAFAVIGILVAVIGLAVSIFIGNVFVVGGKAFFIQNRTQKPGIGKVLEPFRSGHYGNVVLTMFLMDLYIVVWTLLLVVPGIIKSLEYAMVPYIIAENPGMDRKEAFAISKRMMDGEKWNAFVLGLSFIGWELLSVLTCGILAIFYVNPYMNATYVELYEYNKVKAYNEGYIR